ncbi:MAG: hypothetical protein K0V04_21075 [Deltaproteobacteria bacterium]|nr:hypothetical protein [Deltaproteobacteria bacterium]
MQPNPNESLPTAIARHVSTAIRRSPSSAGPASGEPPNYGTLRDTDDETRESPPMDASRLRMGRLLTRPRSWASTLFPHGDVSALDLILGGLHVVPAGAAMLRQTIFRALLLVGVVALATVLPTIVNGWWRLLHHELLVVTISVVGGLLLALTHGIGSALVAAMGSSVLGLTTCMVWWFVVGDRDGGVPGSVAAGTLLGLAAAYHTACSPVEGVETPRSPRAPLVMAGTLVVGFGLGMVLMSVGQFTVLPSVELLDQEAVEVRGILAWLVRPWMLSSDALHQLLEEGSVQLSWRHVRLMRRAIFGGLAGTVVGAGLSVAGWQAASQHYRGREGARRAAPAIVVGTVVAVAAGAGLGVLPPMAPAGPLEGTVVGTVVAFFAVSLFALPVLFVGAHATESTRNTLRVGGLLIVLGVGHPQLVQFSNLADQVNTITLVSFSTVVTVFTVTTALLPRREDQPHGPRQAAAATAFLHSALLLLVVASLHCQHQLHTPPRPDGRVVDNPVIVLSDLPSEQPADGTQGGALPPTKPEAEQRPNPAEIDDVEDTPEPSSPDISLADVPEPDASVRAWFRWLDAQPHPLADAAIDAANSARTPRLLQKYYRHWRQRRDARRAARRSNRLEKSRTVFLARHGAGSGGGQIGGFEWVRRLSPGAYAVLIPPGFQLKLVASFEGSGPASLQIEGVQTIPKSGGSWRSETAGAEGRIVELTGHGHHACPIRAPAVQSRWIGFEDATDNDCNEPSVELQLVDTNALPTS